MVANIEQLLPVFYDEHHALREYERKFRDEMRVKRPKDLKRDPQEPLRMAADAVEEERLTQPVYPRMRSSSAGSRIKGPSTAGRPTAAAAVAGADAKEEEEDDDDSAMMTDEEDEATRRGTKSSAMTMSVVSDATELVCSICAHKAYGVGHVLIGARAASFVLHHDEKQPLCGFRQLCGVELEIDRIDADEPPNWWQQQFPPPHATLAYRTVDNVCPGCWNLLLSGVNAALDVANAWLSYAVVRPQSETTRLRRWIACRVREACDVHLLVDLSHLVLDYLFLEAVELYGVH